MSLVLFGLLHLCTQHAAHNEALISFGCVSTNVFFRLIFTPCMVSGKHSICLIIEITSGRIGIIIPHNHHTFARAIPPHMPISLALEALNIPSASCGSNGRSGRALTASDARGADFDGGAGSWLLMAPCGVAWLVAGVDACGCHDVLRPAEVLDLVRRPCTSRSAL